MSSRVAPAVRALAVVSLANDVASEMVYPLLPALVTMGLGGGPAALGVLDGASDLAASALRWWSGRRADRPRTRSRLIVLGYGLAVLARPVSAFAERAWHVVMVRVVDRVGKGLRSPARDAMIADLSPPQSLGRAFGLHRSADHLGAVIGSLLAFELVRRGWAVTEVIAASVWPGLVALATLGIALRLAARQGPEAEPQTEDARTEDSATGDRPAEEAPRLRRLAWLAALAACRLPEALMLYRLQELGAPVSTVPLVWALIHVVRSVTAYPAGLMADRIGLWAALAAGGVLHAAVLLAIGFVTAPAAAVGLVLLHGVVAGITEPSERAAVARVVPGRRGSGYGRFQAMAGVGSLVAGLGFGLVYQRAGAPLAFAGAAGLSILVLAGWLASERRAPA